MDTLKAILKQEIQDYSGEGANVMLYALLDDENQIYGLATTHYPDRTRPAWLAILARIWDDYIVIEEDRTDRPLVDALLQRGISRDQIILAYAGESIPQHTM